MVFRDSRWNLSLWGMRYGVLVVGATLLVAPAAGEVTGTSTALWLAPCGVAFGGVTLWRCLRSSLTVDPSAGAVQVRNPLSKLEVPITDVVATGWRRGWTDDDVVVLGYRTPQGDHCWKTVWSLDRHLVEAVPTLSSLPRAGKVRWRTRLGLG